MMLRLPTAFLKYSINFNLNILFNYETLNVNGTRSFIASN